MQKKLAVLFIFQNRVRSKKFLKFFAALAAVIGAVYLVATYGEAIVAWAKKMISCPFCAKDDAPEDEAPAEEATTEEPAEEPAEESAEEEPASEVPADSASVEAEDSDFEN